MNNLKQNKAFTLMEIILVLVIVGVVLAFTLTGLFKQIERHHAQEALNTMNLIRTTLESCGVENSYDFSKCGTWDAINFTNPSYNTPAGSNMSASFYYNFDVNINVAHDSYTITATRSGAGLAGNTIFILRNNTGAVTCNGTGDYVGIC